MIFCIDSEKHKRLSEIISAILKEIKRDEGIDAIVMNSYLIHESILQSISTFCFKGWNKY